MNEKEIYLLLNAIKKNTDIKRLVREGLSYSGIARLTNDTISNELVIYEKDNIQLSKKGEELYEQIKDNYKRTIKKEWIEKEKKNRIDKMDKDFIFVPRQNELTF